MYVYFIYRTSFFNRTRSKANSSKSFPWKFMIFEYIVYDIVHMLWKFESNSYIESWDIKRCINGGTF